MSEHLELAKEHLKKASATSNAQVIATRLRWAMWNLIEHLEAQQETPASGLTSHESATARVGSETETEALSPAPLTTTSTPGTAISGRINLPSAHGNSSAGTDGLVTPPEKSRTVSHTSSTRDTDRSTGPSVSIDEALDTYETTMQLFLVGDITESTCLNRLYGLMSKLHDKLRPAPSPSAAAPSATESSEDRSIDEIADEWVSGDCAICEHPRKDHTLRGRCTWMMCQCSINALAFLNITPAPSPESAAQPGKEECMCTDGWFIACPVHGHKYKHPSSPHEPGRE